MATNREAKVKFTAETGEFNANIARANSTLTKLRSELKLNATEMKGAGESVELLSKRQDILAQEAEASQAKIDALTSKLDKAKEIFGENSAEADKFATQLNNARNAEARIQQEIQQVSAALDEQKAAASSAESALGRLETEISGQKQELSSLKDEYKSVVLEQGESSDQAQKLASKISSLNGDLNKNEQKLKEAERAADSLGDAYQDSANDAADSAGGYTMAKDVISDFATQAVQAGIDKLKELGIEGERALNKLQVKTGATSEEMSRYKGVMDEVYAGNYGESYEDVSDAMSTIVSVMGDMPDGKLKSMTESAMTLSDQFDMDVTESVRAANSMMDQFGISGDQAYDLIAQGAQNGLNQNGDLLDTINEYSTQFQQAGYSAEDMMNMIANGAESGTWSIDKLGDAVKEYNIRMTDGTANDALKELGLNAKKVTAEYAKGGDSAKSATSKVVKALMGVEDEQERYQLGQQIMGTMWEDLGEDAVKALFDTEGAASEAKGTMESIKSTSYDDIGNKVGEFGRRFETDIVGPIKDAVMPALGSLVDFFNDNFNIVAPIITGVAVAFGILAGALAISGLISGVSKAFAMLNGVMALNPAVLIVAAIAGVVVAFTMLWKNCEGFRNFWKGLWSKIQAVAKKAWNGIKDTVTKLINKIKEMKEKVTKAFNDLKKNAKTAWSKIKKDVTQAVKNVKDSVTKTFNTVKNFCSKVWNGIKNGIKNAWDGIKNAVKTAVNAVKNTVTKVFNAVKNTASKVWNGIKNTIVKAWAGIKNAVKNAVNAVKTTVSKVFNAIKTTAKTVWNGIKTAITVPINAAKTVVSRVVGTIKSTFDRVKSIKSTVTGVFKSVKNAMTNPIETAKNAISKAIDRIKGIFSGLKLKLPDIKTPHFNISGGKAPWGIAGKGTAPKINIEWYARGGILTKPTIFGANGNKLMAGGENGAEAVLPIATLMDYINAAFDRQVGQLAGAGGATYNVYVNDAVVNDDAQIRTAAKNLLVELARKGAM